MLKTRKSLSFTPNKDNNDKVPSADVLTFNNFFLKKSQACTGKCALYKVFPGNSC